VKAVLELEIGPGSRGGSYVARVVRSAGAGQPSAEFELDVSAILGDRPRVESTVLASSVRSRRVMSPEESVIQSLGAGLFRTVFGGAVGGAYRTSAAVAAERGGNLQLVLRLTAPELAALPWETLFDTETGRYLSRREPLIRRVPGGVAPELTAFSPPLRILGMVASPSGLQALDVGAEKSRLEAALREHLNDGRVELTWLEDASWSGLHARLLQEPWHVLHFIGHGGYDFDTDEGVLALVGRDGRPDYVTANRLADLLDEAQPTPRLVVLNSCQSGAASTTDLFSGTAAALSSSGISAVVAMQFAISDDAALSFARGFYIALANGRGIDEAVRSGRIGVLGLGGDTLEWITPVLYLRGEDTQLLDRPATPRPTGTSGGGSGTSTGGGGTGGAGGRSPRPGRPRIERRVLLGVLAVLALIIAAVAGTVLTLRPWERTGGSGDDGTTADPVVLSIPATATWTPTGIECVAGDTLEITGDGMFHHSPDPTSSVPPEGLSDPAAHPANVEGLPTANTGALIGSIGAQQPYFVVGRRTTHTCQGGGELYLGINNNEVALAGNTGAFEATVTRYHESE
jgi:CHAT domain